MSTRVKPLRAGDSPDPKVNEILAGVEAGGWWGDAAMFGTIGHRPELLKAIVPTFESFFAKGLVEPHIHELMRLKTGQINDCTYCNAVRTQSVKDSVQPKEHAMLEHQPEPSDVLTEREAVAIQLAERMALDPHTVNARFWTKLTGVFSNDEIVELVFASSTFNWGNKFNITMQMDAAPDTEYLTPGMEYREVELSSV